VTFHVVQDGPKERTRLLRLLNMIPLCVHAVVPQGQPLDLYLDMEKECATSAAAQLALHHVTRGVVKCAKEAGLGELDRVAVLDASRGEGSKQSLHAHFRFKRALATRRDAAFLVRTLRANLHPEVATWIDPAPNLSGSLRLYQAVTASGAGRLRILDLTKLRIRELREFLEKRSYADSELVAEWQREAVLGMALNRRWEPTKMQVVLAPSMDSQPFTPSAPAEESSKGHRQPRLVWRAAGTMGDMDEEVQRAVEDGSVARALADLDPGAAKEYDRWCWVLKLMKSISTACESEVAWELFDEFSRESPENYTPAKNKRRWDATVPRGSAWGAWTRLRAGDI